MADKLPTGISVDINFVTGETPTPSKLTAITAQTRKALSNLEKAIGDIRGESFPYTSDSLTTLSPAWGINPITGLTLSGAAERKLDIANIGRLIGPASNLNPKMFGGDKIIVENVPVGVHEFSLRYPTIDTSGVSSTDPSLTTKKNNAANLQIAGDWHVTQLGKVRTVTATAGGTITYIVNPLTFGGGQNYIGSTYNVCPDPNQISQGGNSCSIGVLDGQGRYPVVLPQINYGQNDIDGASVEYTIDDINFQGAPTLPVVLVNNFLTGEIIPEGFIYLKNETTGEIYDQGIYYYNSSNSILVGNIDLTESIASSHKFSILTVGTDITTSIDDLRNKLYHSHDRKYGEPFIHIGDIIGQYELPGSSGIYGPSNMSGNHFSQYLHRDGYQTSLDQNINDGNAMRGALLIGLSGGTPGNYVGTTGGTYSLRFGDNENDGPYIRRSNADQFLVSHLRGDIRLEGGGDIILNPNAAVPSSPTSDAVIVRNAPLFIEEGIRSKQHGTTISMWATQGTLTTPASIDFYQNAASEAEFTSGDILNEDWIDVRFYLQNSTGLWIPAGSSIVTGGSDFLWDYYWDKPGATTRLWFAIYGDWPTSTSTPFQIVVWYLS